MDDPTIVIATGIGAGVCLAAALSVVDQSLNHLGDARLSAIADEGGPYSRHASRVLRTRETLHARLLVSRVVALTAAVALAANVQFFGPGIAPALLVALGLALAYGALVATGLAMLRRRAGTVILALLRVLRPVEWLFAPVAAPLSLLGRLVGSLVPPAGSAVGGDAERLTALAVEYVIEEGEEQGSIAEDQAALLRSVLEFRVTVAREVMVPRTQLTAFDMSAPIEDVIRDVVESGHSRYPVYDGSIDQVVGVLYAKDLFQALQGRDDATPVELRSVVRSPAFFCSENQTVGSLLREMQVRSSHLAVVVDEFGGTSGVLTLEDILEEIVGEIRDEHDDEEASVQELEDGRWVADAGTSVYDLAELIQGFADGPEGDYDSLGGLVVSLAGRVPQQGERFERHGFEFLILDGDERHVKRVQITRAGSPGEASEQEEIRRQSSA